MLLEFTINPIIEPTRQGHLRSNNYRGVQPHQSADNRIKALLSQAQPPQQDPGFPTTSPSHQEDYTSHLAYSIRRQKKQAAAQSHSG